METLLMMNFPTGLRSWANRTDDVVGPNRQRDERLYSRETMADVSVRNENDTSCFC